MAAASSVAKRVVVRMTPEEKKMDLKRRAQEIEHKQARDNTITIMKAHPDSACKALQYLLDLGYTIDESVAAVPLKKSRMATAAANRPGVDDIMPAQTGMSPEVSQADPDDVIPGRFETIGSLKIELIVDKILSVIEPGACSKIIIAATLRRQVRGSGKFETLKLLALATGLDADFPLSGRFRLWSVLLEYAQKMNILRGRRMRDRPLTDLNYAVHGVYKLEITEGEVYITQQVTKVTKRMPLQTEPTRELLNAMTIEYNWSESRARVVVQASGMPPFNISELFPDPIDHVVPEQRQAYTAMIGTRANLAIQNLPANADAYTTPPRVRAALEDLPAGGTTSSSSTPLGDGALAFASEGAAVAEEARTIDETHQEAPMF